MEGMYEYEVRGYLQKGARETVPAFRRDWRDAADFESWRVELIAELRRVLRIELARVSPDVRVISETRDGGILRRKIEYHVLEGVRVPAYVLIPDQSGPRPAVLCIHGHHPANKDVYVGLTRRRVNRYIARTLAERGFVTLTPDQIGFGERGEPGETAARRVLEKFFNAFNRTLRRPCDAANRLAFLAGRTLFGLRIWEALRGMDVLEQTAEADRARIGCVGVSSGGTATLFAAALDERIRCAVCSIGFGSFRDTLAGNLTHCACAYIPDLIQTADLGDIAAAAAPRPLLIQAGRSDAYFAFDGVEREFARAESAYALNSAAAQLVLDARPAGHEMSAQPVVEWFESHL